MTYFVTSLHITVILRIGLPFSTLTMFTIFFKSFLFSTPLPFLGSGTLIMVAVVDVLVYQSYWQVPPQLPCCKKHHFCTQFLLILKFHSD